MQNNVSQLTKFILIAEILVALYMIVSLGRSMYENYQIESYIAETEIKNEEIRIDIAKLERDLAYYKSEQYLDKLAKQNENKVRPGEKVLIIKKGIDENSPDFEQQQLAERLLYLESLTPRETWLLLLRG